MVDLIYLYQPLAINGNLFEVCSLKSREFL